MARITTIDLLQKTVIYGGLPCTYGDMIRDLKSKATSKQQVNMYLTAFEKNMKGADTDDQASNC